MRLFFAVTLLVFSAFSLWMTWDAGFWSVFPPFDSLPTTQIFGDLVVSANLVLFLLARDAREQGRSLWPIAVTAVGVALLGSIALLLYMALDATAARWPRPR
jgi:hypothetical protein